jgi:hypothetical protein
MNAPHWHLAINHLPVVGVFLVMLLLGYALVRGRGELYGVCLGGFVFLALVTWPVYYTGGKADDVLMDVADVDGHLVHYHAVAAKTAFIGAGVLGVISLLALWLGSKRPQISRGAAALVFVLALAETALLGRTANLGGQIRHPEIRSSNAEPPVESRKTGAAKP